MAFAVVKPDQLEWEEYQRYPGRHRAALTEHAGLRHTRSNLIRHEPGSIGPRHVEPVQDETFIPLRGTLTMYLGDPPERLRSRRRYRTRRGGNRPADREQDRRGHPRPRLWRAAPAGLADVLEAPSKAARRAAPAPHAYAGVRGKQCVCARMP